MYCEFRNFKIFFIIANDSDDIDFAKLNFFKFDRIFVFSFTLNSILKVI